MLPINVQSRNVCIPMSRNSSFVMDEEGDWLCEAGEYRDYIHYICASQPSLRRPDPGNWFTPLAKRRARVKVLELDPMPLQRHFDGPNDVKRLEDYLSGPRATRGPTVGRRVVIMEGLRPDYIRVLGEHYGMEPSFFDMQARKGTTFKFDESFDNSKLPSLLEPNRSMCIRYYELWAYTGDICGPFNKLVHHDSNKGNLFLWCSQTGRPILWHNWKYGRGTPPQDQLLLVVPRKCSVWVKKDNPNNPNEWEVVALCDPPPEEIYHEWRPVNNDQRSKHNAIYALAAGTLQPFDGGYEDFIPPTKGFFQFKQWRTPSTMLTPDSAWPVKLTRRSMLDDLFYYYLNHAALLNDYHDPSFFIKKIAAARYLQLIAFVGHQVASIRAADWSGKDDNEALETKWSQFRSAQYIADIEATHLSLGISWGDPSASNDSDWRSSSKDLQYISRRLAALRADYDHLTTAMVGLGGMIGNRQALADATQSLRAAKTVKGLTFIAMFYIPLTFTAGLFSMTDGFSPGAREFKLYFAASIPTLVLTFVVMFFIQIGYNEKGVWSVRHFLDSILGTLQSMKSNQR
ncbi:hypothetical protein K469DRAFT_755152 [Zopfia rhizophila CBS 207.26]|uniref:Cora-domain-containing protein n=1 Tax=Zopfia rhizophila CBS 207.26 TaxID=1314779 RepID=A0A6A6DG26_9PEZI|nr:hypothetical protein K469DRAFT_755152 [Zopfia rhizophila CBS 207.26]